MNIFETKTGERVITQRPNAPIVAAFISWILEKLTSGGTSEFFSVLASVLLITWGALELFWGVNVWRRVLGTVVILLSIGAQAN